jgi:serine/threonine protein kinase
MSRVEPNDFNPRGARFVSQLGDGSFACVELYWHPDTGFFALKRFKGPVFCDQHGHTIKPDPKLRERFQREVLIMWDLPHVSVPRIFSCGMPPGAAATFDPWIAMEFFPAGTLSDFITERCRAGAWPPLTETESLIVLYGVADVLRLLHANRSVHRDVKSLNIFMNDEGEPYLGDFGLTRPVVQRMTPGAGTPIYAAPEMLSGAQDFDERVDVWSLGMVAYEIRTGLCPFLKNGQEVQPTRFQVCEMITTETNMPVLQNDWFTQFFEMCVCPDPEDRAAIDDCICWLNQAAGIIPEVDQAKFDAYKKKLTGQPQPPKLVTVAEIANLAAQGCFKAKLLLARLLEQGTVIPPDHAKAARLFRELAAGGDSEAADALLDMINRGVVPAEGPDETKRLTHVKNAGREMYSMVGTGLQLRLRSLVELASSGTGPWASCG